MLERKAVGSRVYAFEEGDAVPNNTDDFPRGPPLSATLAGIQTMRGEAVEEPALTLRVIWAPVRTDQSFFSTLVKNNNSFVQ